MTQQKTPEQIAHDQISEPSVLHFATDALGADLSDEIRGAIVAGILADRKQRDERVRLFLMNTIHANGLAYSHEDPLDALSTLSERIRYASDQSFERNQKLKEFEQLRDGVRAFLGLEAGQ